MTLGVLIKGLIIGLVVSIPPGPVVALCIKRTIHRGFKSGVVTGIGAASGDTFYALIAGFGLSFVVNFIREEIYWIQLFGAALVIVLAIKLFYANPIVEFRNNRTRKSNPWEEFLSVFLVTISNPTVLFTFLAIFAAINVLGDNPHPLTPLFLVAGVFTGALIWWATLSLIINRFRNKIRLKNIWWLNRILGVVVFVFGLVILLELYF